jgi:glucosamine--fructose-6-phosphate aminotransferase (isomerizing)
VALATELAARAVDVLIAGASAPGAIELPTRAAPAAIAPILLAASAYRMLASLARLRGLDPDRPPHLRKVTETV